MSKAPQHTVEEEAARIGFMKRRGGPDWRKVSWHLQCSKCPRDFTAYWDAGMKPEAMMKKVRIRQWDVDFGMRPLCPDCAHKKDKAPNPKPEHQNFKPWVPPHTAIFDGILAAAEKRARSEKAAAGIDRLLEMELAVKNAQEDRAAAGAVVREARATMTEEARLAGMRARAQHARTMRLQRIADQKAARAAGAEALRVAQMKERCGTQAPPQNAPQAEEEVIPMKTAPTPTPKITHAVFQSLDSVFDPLKRLYRSGYTDQRVARDCGTSEDVVAYLRKETFGDLAEDPRISAIRDDLELLRMESAESFAKLQKALGEITSRVEQVARS